MKDNAGVVSTLKELDKDLERVLAIIREQTHRHETPHTNHYHHLSHPDRLSRPHTSPTTQYYPREFSENSEDREMERRKSLSKAPPHHYAWLGEYSAAPTAPASTTPASGPHIPPSYFQAAQLAPPPPPPPPSSPLSSNSNYRQNYALQAFRTTLAQWTGERAVASDALQRHAIWLRSLQDKIDSELSKSHPALPSASHPSFSHQYLAHQPPLPSYYPSSYRHRSLPT